MKEFETTFKGLSVGLRAFKNVGRNDHSLVECYNLEPKGKEEGPVIHEALTSLNATATWEGEGQKAASALTRDITIYVADYVNVEDVATVTVYLDGVSQGTTDSNGELDIADVAVGGHLLKLTKTDYTDSDADDLYNDFIMVI